MASATCGAPPQSCQGLAHERVLTDTVIATHILDPLF